ncbi:MAG TPA: glycoside hydrolase family 32 protein [Flavitalea sp.]|nr:glycoside hydrolase family 32 protein [Flavitalea sp.]
MKSTINCLLFCCALAGCGSSQTASEQKPAATSDTGQSYNERHRPQFHFSPKEKWMNDPNGMVYFNNQYHLFYQYYPDSTVWGPMHWGHATSKDLITWDHQPIALYPDSLGYIFSGSAVADVNNTSGFGKDGKIPLVAIFTHHDPKKEKSDPEHVETQSIAYSLDEGKTWTKYTGNPVLKNPGIRDFRDPKVSWFEPTKKWIMTLATSDRITFYSSPDLKDWTKESEFGKDFGAHGGVWECPDLFPLDHDGQKIWILVVNINPGGPNGGSATQYFTGSFDGSRFTPFQTDTRWIDYGPDEYAGITWSNTGDRKIFLGWMSNWQYANIVPTDKWRSATTIPRDLGLQKIGDKYFVTSMPVPELQSIEEKPVVLQNIAAKSYRLDSAIGKSNSLAKLKIQTSKLESFTLTLSNDAGENVMIGYDQSANSYFLDRTNSGNVAFEKGFAKKHTAPRFVSNPAMDMTLVIDKSSIELFADNGLTVMTQIFFPSSPFTNMKIESPGDFTVDSLEYVGLRSIWK